MMNETKDNKENIVCVGSFMFISKQKPKEIKDRLVKLLKKYNCDCQEDFGIIIPKIERDRFMDWVDGESNE